MIYFGLLIVLSSNSLFLPNQRKWEALIVRLFWAAQGLGQCVGKVGGMRKDKENISTENITKFNNMVNSLAYVISFILSIDRKWTKISCYKMFPRVYNKRRGCSLVAERLHVPELVCARVRFPVSSHIHCDIKISEYSRNDKRVTRKRYMDSSTPLT